MQKSSPYLSAPISILYTYNFLHSFDFCNLSLNESSMENLLISYYSLISSLQWHLWRISLKCQQYD